MESPLKRASLYCNEGVWVLRGFIVTWHTNKIKKDLEKENRKKNAFTPLLPPLKSPLMPPIFFTICANFLYCVSNSLTSFTDTPAPLATRCVRPACLLNSLSPSKLSNSDGIDKMWIRKCITKNLICWQFNYLKACMNLKTTFFIFDVINNLIKCKILIIYVTEQS